jgi:hypothetical protein
MIFSQNREPPPNKSGAGFFEIMLYAAVLAGQLCVSDCRLRHQV